MFYNLNTHLEKVIVLQGKEYFVPNKLPDEVRIMVERIDQKKSLIDQWNSIARKLLHEMNKHIPQLNKTGIQELISVIDSY